MEVLLGDAVIGSEVSLRLVPEILNPIDVVDVLDEKFTVIDTDIRAADPFHQGGGRPFSKTDRSTFLQALDRVTRLALKDG